MNNIDIFSNTQFGSLRTFLSTENKIWFCLADVCKILDLQQVSRVKSRLKANGVTIIKGVSQTTNQYGTTSEQEVEMNFIDEPNLYRCVFQSRKKEAEHFQTWIFEEVLPSIRQKGGYIATHQDDTPEIIMARALKLADQTIKQHQQQIQILKGERDIYQQQVKTLTPKAQYTDEVLQSDTTYTLTQVAHDLQLQSVHKLTAILKTKGYLYRQSGQWQPTAQIATRGYFTTRTHRYFKSDNTIGTSVSTVFTERGRQWAHQLKLEKQ